MAAVVLFALAAVAAGRAGGMADAPRDGVGGQLPTGPFGATELQGLLFSQVMRGYDMKQVDDALDRIAAELTRRDERIRQLTERSAPADGGRDAPSAGWHDGPPAVAGAGGTSTDRHSALLGEQWQPAPDAGARDELAGGRDSGLTGRRDELR